MTTAILAVQGAFIEHAHKLEVLGEPYVYVRSAQDLSQGFDRLILPGGESTVQAKLLYEQHMLKLLQERIKTGMPVLATCAGLILLAQKLEGENPHERFGTLPITVRRNAYGRQLASFHTELEFAGLGRVPATFIRAPQILAPAPEVCELACYQGIPVAVQANNQLALAFHPELDQVNAIHQYFLSL